MSSFSLKPLFCEKESSSAPDKTSGRKVGLELRIAAPGLHVVWCVAQSTAKCFSSVDFPLNASPSNKSRRQPRKLKSHGSTCVATWQKTFPNVSCASSLLLRTL
mmetsp:Transcript_17445/g.30753  ORF Transcript_17445/g.30753 Transcript_17445/m.30753 type:complete len:104 (-) Transcript_17445:66-377(-)